MLSLLALSLIFAQSFPEKPDVPVYNVKGQKVVRVDCWGINQDFKTLFLNADQHPHIYESEVLLNGGVKMILEVSLLQTENTLNIRLESNHHTDIEVSTYGMGCGLSVESTNIYCSIFDGELNE